MSGKTNAASDDDIAGLRELHDQGRFEDLLDAAATIATMRPDLPVVHSLLAAAHAELGRYDEAISALRRAIAIDPADAPAHHNLGSVYLRMDQPGEAISAFRRAVELRPARADLRHGLGAASFAAGRVQDAIASAREALRLDPSSATYSKALAEYLIAGGSEAEAIAVLEQAARIAPDDQDVRVVLGEAYARLGRLEDALASFQVAARLKPDDAELFVRIASFWGRHNGPEKELEALERAVGMAPGNALAQRALAHALLDRGRRDEAIAAFETSLMLQPDNAEARHMLAAAKGERPPAPPAGYVAELFDDYARTFDFSLTKDLDYRAPHRVAALLARHLPAPGQFESVLDLGCGTGLFGVEIRPLSQRLSGVDLSPKMIAAARRKNVYDRLEVGDIVEAITRDAGAHDAYAAVDVLIYVGALGDVFDAIRTSARAGALFAFSTEHLDSGTYTLRDSGRYAHSRAYVAQLCAERNLDLLSAEIGPLRKEHGQMLDGGIYLAST